MTKPPLDDPDSHGLTAHQAMSTYRATLKRLDELTVEEIDRDLARVEGLDYFEQLVLRTKWMKEVELWLAVRSSMKQYETPLGRSELGVDGLDLDGRLERYKKDIAADYERRVKSDIDVHQITSPVAKLFLMEWHFERADEKCGARIRPQHQVILDGRELRCDFMVESTDGTKKLAIELDRHDFQEETRQQAARDRQRERTLVRSGYSLFRFTGLEIVRDPQSCVEEVVSAFSPTNADR
jgi:very-short-patch-repair endonuclease